MPAKPRDTIAYSLRIDRSLHEALKVEAERSDRSLAREMMYRLRRDLPADKKPAKRRKLGACRIADGA